jgi:ribosome-associated protein
VPRLFVTARLTIPDSELVLSFARSRGPGGQHVNKVESKVELRWAPAASAALTGADRDRVLAKLAWRITSSGDLIVTSERTRDQSRNRADARQKLAALVAWALSRPKPRQRTRPSRAARERRLRDKKRRAQVKRGRGRADDK